MILPGKLVCINPGNFTAGPWAYGDMVYPDALQATELWPMQSLPRHLVHQSTALFDGPEAGWNFSAGQLGKVGG